MLPFCRESSGFGPVVPVVPVGPVDVGVRIFVLLFLAPKWVDIVYLSLVAVCGKYRLF